MLQSPKSEKVCVGVSWLIDTPLYLVASSYNITNYLDLVSVLRVVITFFRLNKIRKRSGKLAAARAVHVFPEGPGIEEGKFES